MTAPWVITAGGTGGHIVPGLAIAQGLRAAGHDVAWLGAREGMEADWVRRAGLPFYGLAITGVRGKGPFTWCHAPWMLGRSCYQAVRLLRRLKPVGVVGLGGYAAAPACWAAVGCRVPLFLHEQNAVMGWTNRGLARWAQKVFTGYKGVASSVVIHEVGNPLMPAVTAVGPAAPRIAQRRGPVRLLVLGGSQGAERLNHIVPQALGVLQQRPPHEPGWTVWHQAGSPAARVSRVRAAYEQVGVAATVSPHITCMSQAYRWADAVVSRAGAITLSELSAVGLPAVIIPYPGAVDDHQTHNAAPSVQRGGAYCLQGSALTPVTLADALARWHTRDALCQDAERAYVPAARDATERMLASLLGTGT